jgi:phosphoribosylformylglycinamidine synthase
VYQPPPARPLALPPQSDFTDDLKGILASLNVCSKHWIIRQYDHEVQAGTVVKPLVGACNDGPSDAAVVCPVLGSRRGLAISCGMNPRYGDLDPYWMAASAIDEAVRNCVAVGADPGRIALLDNFCWANTDRPEVLGSLVRAALACHDVAIAYGTPFISGKDSLNNEFHPKGGDGSQERIAIPPSLLISALGQIDDVARCVTMDLKRPGNPIYLLGETRDELGGSHYALVHGLEGGQVPRVDAAVARVIFERLHGAIERGLVRSCHDLSEGGLAVALAEMCFAGDRGAAIRLPRRDPAGRETSEERQAGQMPQLFAESNSRFLVEVQREREQEFVDCLRLSRPADEALFPVERLGEVTDSDKLVVRGGGGDDESTVGEVLIEVSYAELKRCWQRPLDW